MEKNTNCTNIIFRSKFTKYIQCDAEHDVFVSAFEKFIALDKSSAIDIIWRMSCTPCAKELWKIGLCPETISEEMYVALRNELRHQYEFFYRSADQDSRDFWSDAIPVFEEAQEAFDELKAQSNIIVATVVFQKCHSYLLRKSTEKIERVLFLLNAYKESNNYGGICELGFDAQEADYLKSIHSKIHDLSRAMFDSKRYCKDTLTHKPFESLGKQIKETGNDLPFTFGDDADTSAEESTVGVQEEILPEETTATESVDCIPMFIAITAENVLEYKDIFYDFAITRDMSSLITLNKHGFDLNQVVAKETAIINLLKAAEALNN